MTRRTIFVLLAIFALALAHAASAIACAVCLSGADDAITGGYNASVLFLMAAPYVVGACIAAGLVVAYRRALRRREQDGENPIGPMGLNQEENSR
jgi:hypothetical protein